MTTPAETRRPPRPLAPTALSPARHAWLEHELDAWCVAGLLEPHQVEPLRARYRSSRSFSLAPLLLGLGALFVGGGLIWLVAANLAAVPPSARLLGLLVLWLGLLLGSEALASRRVADETGPGLLVATGRLLAALVVGAVLAQAGQTLQLPAGSLALLGAWSLAALLQAYALRAVGPLLVAVATGLPWVVWAVATQLPDAPDGVPALVLTLLGAASVGLSVGHQHLGWSAFASVWRTVGTLLGLALVLVAVLAPLDGGTVSPTTALVVALGALVVAAPALVAGTPTERLEVALATGTVLLAALLWSWPVEDLDLLAAPSVLRGGAALLAYVVLAVAVAGLAAVRGDRLLTVAAGAGLALLTVVQSFAVLTTLATGAVVFVLVGLVLMTTGWGFDRARRRMAVTLGAAS